MTVERVGAAASSDVPVPSEAALPPDPALAAAVDDAVIGDLLAGLPEASPERPVGSPNDVSSLYIRHRAGLAAHARRFLRDPRDVDEVVQETFLRLFLSISEIETELQAIAFARRTLTNLCIDRYRAERRRPRLIDLESAPVADVHTPLEDDDPVLRAEDAAIVRDALSRLSPLHRAALVKREIEEKTLPQIADELGVPEDSVKHLLFRARRALRRLLVGTSVEPGVALTAAEVAALANRRLARSVMQGANMLIVLVVVSVLTAVGVRPLFDHSRQVTTEGSGGQAAVGGSGLAPLPGIRPRPRHHRTGPVHKAVRHVTSTVGATPAGASKPPAAPHPTKPQKNPTPGTGTARAHLKLSGPLTVTGAPELVDGKSATGPGGAAVAQSSFTAATDQGTFVLDQSMMTSNVAGTSISLDPSFVVGSQVERPTMTRATTSVGTDADGNITITSTAGAEPDYSTNAFPLTSVTVDLVVTPDFSQVISESVDLTAQSYAPPPASASSDTGCPNVTGSTPSYPVCAPSSGVSAATSGAPSVGSGSGMSDVVENLRHVR